MRDSVTSDDVSCRNGKKTGRAKIRRDCQLATVASALQPTLAGRSQANQLCLGKTSACPLPPHPVHLHQGAILWHVRSRTHSSILEPGGGEPASVSPWHGCLLSGPKCCQLRVDTAGRCPVREAPDVPGRNSRFNLSLLINSCSHGEKCMSLSDLVVAGEDGTKF